VAFDVGSPTKLTTEDDFLASGDYLICLKMYTGYQEEPILIDTQVMTVTNLPPAIFETYINDVDSANWIYSASAWVMDGDWLDDVTCTVDYGDGTVPQPGELSMSSCDGPDHEYAEAGIYTVTITLTEASFDPVTASFQLEVLDPNPDVFTWSPLAPTTGETVTFSIFPDLLILLPPEMLFEWTRGANPGDTECTEPLGTDQTAATTFSAAGDYMVCLHLLNLPVQEITNNQIITVTDAPQTTHSISGTVFDDQNINGVFDAGEPGLPGMTVGVAKDCDWENVITAATGADGGYAFTGLDAGQHYCIDLAPSDSAVTRHPDLPASLDADLTGMDFGSTAQPLFSWTPSVPDEGAFVDFTAASGFANYAWAVPQAGESCEDQYSSHDSSPAANLHFGVSGSYQVCVEITDATDWSFYDSQLVTVANVAPVPYAEAAAIFPEPSEAGSPIQTAGAPFFDVDHLASCTVDYGDGSGAQAGTIPAEENACEGPAHTYTTAGTYPVTFTAYDPDGASGSATIDHVVTAPAGAPIVTAQPQNVSVEVGDAAGFNSAADGSPTPTVQWQVLSSEPGAVWTDLLGETGAALSFTAAYAQNGYQYRAVFTNSAGSATSDPATLTVSKKTVLCTITGWSGSYDGSAHGASGNCTAPDGTTLSGLSLGAAFTTVPGGTAHWTFAGGLTYNDQSGDAAVVIAKASAGVSLSGLTQAVDGSPKPVTVTMTPAGLNVVVTYNGVASAPSAAGSYAVVATVDDANYQGSASDTLNLTAPYTTAGFSAPIDLSSVFNAAKAGQMIPLKWRLLDGSGSPVTDLDPSAVTLALSPTACPSGAAVDAIEAYASGTSLLQNLGNGYYQLNWKTDKAWAGSCKKLTLKIGAWTGDGLAALFWFKK
jgi:PKD repeat protein